MNELAVDNIVRLHQVKGHGSSAGVALWPGLFMSHCEIVVGYNLANGELSVRERQPAGEQRQSTSRWWSPTPIRGRWRSIADEEAGRRQRRRRISGGGGLRLNPAPLFGRHGAVVLLVAGWIAGTAGPSEGLTDRHTPVTASPMTVVAARDSALLMSRGRGGEIAGALTWTVDEGSTQGDRVPLRFAVEIDGKSLMAGAPSDPVNVEIIAYLLGEGGQLISHVANKVAIDNADDRGRIMDAGLSHLGELAAAKGRCSLRVLVRNRTTGRYCLIRRELALDLDSAGTQTLLPPIVLEERGRWLRTIQPGVTTEGARLLPSGAPWWPPARHAWRSDQQLAVLVAGSVVAKGQPVTARILDATGTVVLEPHLDLGSVTVSDDGMGVATATLAAPELASGRYRLVISVDQSPDRPSIERRLSVWIHDRADVLVWTDLSELVQETVSAAHPAPSVGPDPSPQVEIEPSATPKAAVVPAATYSRPPQIAIQLPGVDAHGAALLLSGHSGGEANGALTWTVEDPGDPRDDVGLRFVVEVDGATLLADSPSSPVPIEVAAYLLDENDALIAHVASGVVLDTDDELSGVLGSGLKHVGGVNAPRARCSLRVLVRNRVSGDYYLERRDLDLEHSGPKGPILLPPIVPEPADRWFKTIQPGLSMSSVETGAADSDAWPSARPAWRSDLALAVVAAGSAVANGRSIAVRLEDRYGSSVLEPGLRLGSRANDLPLGSASGEVEAPDLPSGEYRLVMFVDDEIQDRSTDQPLSVVIHDRPDELAWTDLGEEGDSRNDGLSTMADEPTHREIEHNSMRAAYLAGLRAWAGGDRVASRRMLSDLERPIAEKGNTGAWRKLVAAEGSVLSDLSSERPAVLMAAVLIHRDMYHWYLARTESSLASHSWESAALLALEAEKLEGWQPPAGFTEAVLLDLADHLVRSGKLDDARQLLEAAEKITADSSRSLLALGALAEKSGRPSDAIRPLRRLVGLEPDHLEARLRLAVCRARIGDWNEAEEYFRGLVTPEVIPWIRTLAYQELGRMLIANARLDDAVDVLLEGTSAIPDSQRMRILLAHALDLAGRPAQASSALAGVGSGSERREESARYRYSQWPEIDRGQFRAPLAEAELEAREALRGVTP